MGFPKYGKLYGRLIGAPAAIFMVIHRHYENDLQDTCLYYEGGNGMQFIHSLIIFVLFFLMTFLLSKWTTGTDFQVFFKDEDPENLQGLEEHRFREYLDIYLSYFRTLDVRSLAAVSTDLYYHTTAQATKLLTRLGLRREMDLHIPPDTVSERLSIAKIGKVAWAAQDIKCDYSERLVDSVSGRVLHKKLYKNAKFGFNLNKNPNRQQEQERFCAGCGGPLQPNGELFICQNCGTTYHSDSADWVINGANVTPSVQQNPFILLMGAIGGFLALFPLIAFFSLFIKSLQPFANASVTVLYCVIVAYFLFAFWYYYPLVKMQRSDKLSNMFRLTDRLNFLLIQMIQCREESPGGMQPFLAPEAFEGWTQQCQYQSENRIIDHALSFPPIVRGYVISNGRQHYRLKVFLKLTVFNERTRRISTVKRTLNMGLYRNAHVRYQNLLNSEAFYCKGCGMPVDITGNGKCKYCGTVFDLAEIDWIVEYLDNGLLI